MNTLRGLVEVVAYWVGNRLRLGEEGEERGKGGGGGNREKIEKEKEQKIKQRGGKREM